LVVSNNNGSAWYEKDPVKTLELLSGIPDRKNPTIFLPRAGTSNLIEILLDKGAKLILNDISNEALEQVKKRLNGRAEDIIWLCQDIAQPVKITVPKVDFWIDRAVLHFLTDEDCIKGYMDNLRSLLKPDGYAAFAEFSMIGALKCAGLTLHRYSIEELSERLGASFKLISHFEHTYINPFGDPRPYIYALYKKEK
jgi:hypothetical protein